MTVLDKVESALAAIKSKGTFAVELACGSGDLHIEVEGVGPIRFPIAPATARKLCAVARPAPFGRRDRTLHDKSVRDTWEIDGSGISLDETRWRRTLEPQLAIIRKSLGFAAGGELQAALDKMLVYAPGQFFAPHQDSERADDMAASLVVTLPSVHSGGATTVQHHAAKKDFRGAKRGPKDLSLLAFYADCNHEVAPVESGHRIVLTYHLLYLGTKDSAEVPGEVGASALDRLAESVREYFSTPVAIPNSSSLPQRPDRLIYLLDHQYTEKSLAWGRLKNADRLRASALRQAAERLDCEIFLALADVHESWSCDGGDWDGGYGRRYHDEWDDDDLSEEDGDTEGYEPVDLIDSSVELRHWLDRDGAIARGVPTIPGEDEICSTRESSEMDPFKSEHEGYMGNYGNTVDRWYHRAAVVMWPRERNFVLRAKVSPSWAAGRIASRLKAGAREEAVAMARSVLPFWKYTASQEKREDFLLKVLQVAASLDDAELAHDLLSPFGPNRLTSRTIPPFVALVARHGLSWSQRLFTAWTEHARYDTPPWRASLPALCEALVAAPGHHCKALAAWLLAKDVASFKEEHAAALDLPAVVQREELANQRNDDLLALLESARVIGAAPVRDDLVAFLLTPETGLPLMSAGALLEKCREARGPAAVRAIGLEVLYRDVVNRLERILAAPARGADDWSIEPPARCKCPLCQELAAFLRDRGRVEHPWPLAQEKRRHIHNVIDSHGLPVMHTTVRRGRPYTLVLRKTKELFEREAELRERQRTLLRRLKKQRRAFTGA